MIIQSGKITSDLSETAEVCIIGSGAGGAVLAAELAAAGFDTLVIEEGEHLTKDDFTTRLTDALPLLYRNNSFIVAIGRSCIPISIGCCVGGSTTVNSATCFRAPESLLSGWERDYGLKGLGAGSLDKYFDRVEKKLNVAPGSPEYLGGNARVFKRGMEALGLSGGPIMRNARGCRGCGVCPSGCPEGAKQSMGVTYIPDASAAGARIYAGCRAGRIIVEKGRARGVEAEFISRRTGKVHGRLKVRAKLVIAACGAIYTPLLLLRSRLCNSSGQVGKNLRLHPGTRVAALFDEDIEAWKGITQSFYIDSFKEEGILLEATTIPPAAQAFSLPYFGSAHRELMSRYKNLANAGILVSDSSIGRVRPGPGGTPLVTYRLNRHDREKTLRAVEILSKVYFSAGAKKVFPSISGLPVIESEKETTKIRDRKVRKGDIEYVSFHPMGTCRMGEDPERSVVGPNLESHDVKNLFICDAGIFPTSLGVNPQMTIMAFATRLSELIKENREVILSR